MKRTNLSTWVKDAGPFGIALWGFDALVAGLVNLEDQLPRSLPAYNENDESLGLILILMLIFAVLVLIGLIVFFPSDIANVP